MDCGAGAAAEQGIVSSETVTASSMTRPSSRCVTHRIARLGAWYRPALTAQPKRDHGWLLRGREVVAIIWRCSWLLGSFGLGAGDVGHDHLGAVRYRSEPGVEQASFVSDKDFRPSACCV